MRGRGIALVRPAILQSTDLRGAHALRAFFVRADLDDRNLSEANLFGADLIGYRLVLSIQRTRVITRLVRMLRARSFTVWAAVTAA